MSIKNKRIIMPFVVIFLLVITYVIGSSYAIDTNNSNKKRGNTTSDSITESYINDKYRRLDYHDILNKGINFGIITRSSLRLGSEIYSNFATNYFEYICYDEEADYYVQCSADGPRYPASSGSALPTFVIQNMDSSQNTFEIGNVINFPTLILPDDVTAVSAAGEEYTHSDEQFNIDEYFKDNSSLWASLSEQNSCNSCLSVANGGYDIDVTGVDSSTVYITINGDTLPYEEEDSLNRKLLINSINGRKDQTIIINVDGSDSYLLQSTYSELPTSQIIFNFNNAKYIYINDLMGILLAPQSSVIFNEECKTLGWIIADSLTIEKNSSFNNEYFGENTIPINIEKYIIDDEDSHGNHLYRYPNADSGETYEFVLDKYTGEDGWVRVLETTGSRSAIFSLDTETISREYTNSNKQLMLRVKEVKTSGSSGETVINPKTKYILINNYQTIPYEGVYHYYYDDIEYYEFNDNDDSCKSYVEGAEGYEEIVLSADGSIIPSCLRRVDVPYFINGKVSGAPIRIKKDGGGYVGEKFRIKMSFINSNGDNSNIDESAISVLKNDEEVEFELVEGESAKSIIFEIDNENIYSVYCPNDVSYRITELISRTQEGAEDNTKPDEIYVPVFSRVNLDGQTTELNSNIDTSLPYIEFSTEQIPYSSDVERNTSYIEINNARYKRVTITKIDHTSGSYSSGDFEFSLLFKEMYDDIFEKDNNESYFHIYDKILVPFSDDKYKIERYNIAEVGAADGNDSIDEFGNKLEIIINLRQNESFTFYYNYNVPMIFKLYENNYGYYKNVVVSKCDREHLGETWEKTCSEAVSVDDLNDYYQEISEYNEIHEEQINDLNAYYIDKLDKIIDIDYLNNGFITGTLTKKLAGDSANINEKFDFIFSFQNDINVSLRESFIDFRKNGESIPTSDIERITEENYDSIASLYGEILSESQCSVYSCFVVKNIGHNDVVTFNVLRSKEYKIGELNSKGYTPEYEFKVNNITSHVDFDEATKVATFDSQDGPNTIVVRNNLSGDVHTGIKINRSLFIFITMIAISIIGLVTITSKRGIKLE